MTVIVTQTNLFPFVSLSDFIVSLNSSVKKQEEEDRTAAAAKDEDQCTSSDKDVAKNKGITTAIIPNKK